VVAVSEPIAAALASIRVPRARIAVLTPFSTAMIARREAPAALAPFRVARWPLFAAALAPGATYGADVLLAAYATVRERFPGAGLAVFGPGTGALARDGVLALGELPHAAALAVIEASDAFVRPTRADGDALSVREALALGRPVVASAAGHRPPGCLLFPPGDPAALEPCDALGALYASHAAPRPRTDGGRRPDAAPTF
jgi:hypothetical protein